MHQNNERLFLVNTKLLTNCSPYFIVLKVINNLDTQRSFNTMVNLENLKLKKKNSSGSKIIRSFVKVDQNIYKRTPKIAPQGIIIISFFSCERLLLSP